MRLDLTNVKENSNEPFPAGAYKLKCTEAELKDTKTGSGKYIKCTFEVVEGDYTKRKLWHNFNIQNDNQQAQDIGLGQLKSFLKFSGKNPDVLESPSELIGLYANCKVSVKKSDIYDAANEIKGFKKIEEDVGF